MNIDPGMDASPSVERRFFLAIAAMAENRVIGRGGEIPWHLPEDFRWFKQRTMGQILVMGRRTFESIGRPLPGRVTVVLSRTGFRHPSVRTIERLDAIDPRRESQEVFICGGAQVYALALPHCSDLYLTEVRRRVEGEVLFPRFEDRFEPVAVLQEHAEFAVRHYRNRRPEPLPSRL